MCKKETRFYLSCLHDKHSPSYITIHIKILLFVFFPVTLFWLFYLFFSWILLSPIGTGCACPQLLPSVQWQGWPQSNEITTVIHNWEIFNLCFIIFRTVWSRIFIIGRYRSSSSCTLYTIFPLPWLLFTLYIFYGYSFGSWTKTIKWLEGAIPAVWTNNVGSLCTFISS